MKKLTFLCLLITSLSITSLFAQQASPDQPGQNEAASTVVSPEIDNAQSSGLNTTGNSSKEVTGKKSCCAHGVKAGKSCCKNKSASKNACSHAHSEKAEAKQEDQGSVQ